MILKNFIQLSKEGFNIYDSKSTLVFTYYFNNWNICMYVLSTFSDAFEKDIHLQINHQFKLHSAIIIFLLTSYKSIVKIRLHLDLIDIFQYYFRGGSGGHF